MQGCAQDRRGGGSPDLHAGEAEGRSGKPLRSVKRAALHGGTGGSLPDLLPGAFGLSESPRVVDLFERLTSICSEAGFGQCLVEVFRELPPCVAVDH